MGRLALKRNISTQSLCLFCAYGLAVPSLARPSLPSSRSVWTTSSRFQQFSPKDVEESGGSIERARKIDPSKGDKKNTGAQNKQAQSKKSHGQTQRQLADRGRAQDRGRKQAPVVNKAPSWATTSETNIAGNRPSPNLNLGAINAGIFKANPPDSVPPTKWNLEQSFEVKEPPPAPKNKTQREPGSNHVGKSRPRPVASDRPPDFKPDGTSAQAQDIADSSNTWKHLRLRNTTSKTSTADEPTTTPQHELGDEWVDAAFRRHQEEREKLIVTPSRGRVGGQLAEQDKEKQEARHHNRTCARCGEVGHIARNCNNVNPKKEDQDSKTKFRIDYTYVNASHDSASTPVSSEPRQNKDDAAEERRAQRLRKFAAEEAQSANANTNKLIAPRQRRFEESDRKRSRNTRRNYNDEDDDIGAIRDGKNAQKAARKAEQEQKRSAKIAHLERRRSEGGTPINLSSYMSVAQLAQALNVHYEEFVSRLERLGYDDVFPGKILNAETSGMIAMEFDFDPVFDEAEREAEERDLFAQPEIDDKEFLPTRPPVVTIMGHVDHGKTTILDYIRKSSVAAGEAGGITQHIGAFSVPMTSSGKTVTFLDTPGHAAFLAMRQRGANVTDIVILVVAADDSVKPQTLEAIKHAKAAGVPMIVAVNKVDKEEADIQRVKQDLARHQIDIEDYGGETQVVPVSGKTGQGMTDLEETVVTLSEILDHRAPTDGVVEGWILEAETKKSGRVATVLVRRGTLRPGTILVAGKTWTRVRSLRNEGGQVMSEVGPGMPVEVDGWRDQPAAGDEVLEARDEQKAGNVVAYRLELDERARAIADMEVINDAKRVDQEKRAVADAPSHTSNDTGGHMSVPFIIKADVSGSAEAVSSYILSVSHPMISPTVLNSGVGQIFESDIDLAAVAGACIVSFNLPVDDRMRALAESKGVRLIENNIIYRVLDDVKSILEARLPPIVTQRVLGEAEIGASFEIGLGGRKKVKIAGCKVRNGVIGRNARVRVMRKEEKIYEGTLASLKNVKKDVDEMRKGTECGMAFADWEGFEIGDHVQAFEEHSEKRKL